MIIHIVEKDETLMDIAKEYNISVQRLISDNGIYDTEKLVEGQAIVVLIPEKVHIVQTGDTIESIAAQYGITTINLLQNNPFLIGNQELSVGEEIAITFSDNKIGEIKVNAYAYPNIEPKVLDYALPYLSRLTIFGYGFTKDADLIPTDDNYLIKKAYEYGAEPIMLLSTIDESGEFSSKNANIVFNDSQLQVKLINNIVENMKKKGYRGLDVDFEFIDPESREGYTNFVRNITEKLNNEGFSVNVDLAPKTYAEQPGLLYESHDYPVIGSIADTVLVMTYEWGYTYGPPMAVAPIKNVRQVIDYAISEIPLDKIFMGIPSYAYDWKLPYKKGESEAKTLGNLQALRLAQIVGSEIQYDEESQTPYFVYTQDGIEHVVWFEDARSIQEKLKVIEEEKLLGAGYWNIMRPFPQNWVVLNSMFDIEKI